MNLFYQLLKQNMSTRKGLICLFVTVWVIMDVKIEAYKSGCSGGYCFVISDYNNKNERLNQSTAQQRCRSNWTQLVEIRNKDIQNSLINFIWSVYNQGNLNGWDVLTNGKRTSRNWLRLNGKGIGSSITVYEQTYSSYAYGYLKSNTSGFDLFASKPTDNIGGFICTGLSDCSGGVMINGQCYRSFTETLSWYEARNRCLDGGGELASFDHITTNTGFNALNGSWINPSNSYWIGIKREWWIWQSSNSDAKYSDWITGHPIKYVPDTDCLCLSTYQWKWIECGCNWQFPFVCISDSTTSSTTKTSTTSTSTTTRSTKSTGRDAVIGIGVGVGIGGALVIIALVAVVVILCRKRCPLRCLQVKKNNSNGRLPDILMKDSVNKHHSSDAIDVPYARIVSSSSELNNADTNAYENFNQTPTVYAQLGFCTEPQLHRDGSVTIVAGKAKPFPAPSPPKNNNATNHFKVGGDLYAEETEA